MATSAIDSYGMISNAYTESKLEESNIESNTDTDNEMIVKEKGIDSVPQEETVEETESTKETTTKIVDQVNEVSELITEQVEVKQTQQNS
jgi:hypothetical protein